MNDKKVIQAARDLVERSLLYYRGRPVGTVAAMSLHPQASINYGECFIRDFFVSGLMFLADGREEIVKNFLETVCECHCEPPVVSGHEMVSGVMPASFRVEKETGGAENLVADFGDRAIGRVASVDSMMWWILLLDAYTRRIGNRDLVNRCSVQNSLRRILHMLLRDSFEVFPTLLVPDASFMIDRRMGVYGHPLEIQSLFYGTLLSSLTLLEETEENRDLRTMAEQRMKVLRSYIRIFYWMDLERLSEINRFTTEEFGTGSVNMLNVYPESIPEWLSDWLPDHGGYLVGNLGPGRMDFRFFAQGNLLAILFDLAADQQPEKILNLYEERWNALIGHMPAKICFPAMEGVHWQLVTGSDPKNVPWSYHNGGNWPVLLWSFTAAALRVGRRDLAEKALASASERLLADQWPEYYDGRRGRLIGRRANLNQVWSASGYLLARQFLEDPGLLDLFPH